MKRLTTCNGQTMNNPVKPPEAKQAPASNHPIAPTINRFPKWRRMNG